MIKIGDIQFSDVSQFDGITIKEYEQLFFNVYCKIEPTKRSVLISEHYAELKKHFTKIEKPSKKKDEIFKGED